MSDFAPVDFPTVADHASALRISAKRFDQWADEVSGMVSGVQNTLARDGEPVWRCQKADEFYRLFNDDPAFGKNIPDLKAAYRDTADNMRRTARELEELAQNTDNRIAE